MKKPLAGKSILIFVGDDYEDMELQYPKYRMLEAGADVIVAGLEADVIHKGKHGYPQIAQAAVTQLSPDNFDGLIIPGGWMPDKLRRYDAIKNMTRTIAEQDKPIASICHGPWIDISAGIVKGINYTSTPGLTDDLTNAGAIWHDEPVVVDGKRVSSRRPDDLPKFCAAYISVFGESD